MSDEHAAGRRIVNLAIGVPEGMSYDYVYRLELEVSFEMEERDDVRFVLLEGPLNCLPLLPAAARWFGAAGAARQFLRLLSPTRMLYACVSGADGFAHVGSLLVGHCPHFWVGPDEIAIGPIMTLKSWRGLGLATFAMKSTINALLQRGYKVFYVNANCENIASQKVMEKCGFGLPVGVYIRGSSLA